ncbi:MAG: FAD-dependent oxidoreductase, partial [Clostridiales bacterium]|nr:FAD-dependent oxidoreductase [Clostridiales bacterium]
VIQTCISQTDEDYGFWKGLSAEEYKEVKEELIAQVTARIVEAYPELSSDMEFLDCWTPLTYERYCNAYHGSYMSFVTTPEGKQIRLKGKLKGIDNLYLAGQWTNSPGGLPVAVASGKFAIQRLLKNLRRDINI